MALEQSFHELVERFQRLLEVAADLTVNVVEDHPLGDELLLVEQLSDSAVQMESLAEEGLSATKVAVGAAGYPLNIDRLRQQLIAVQRTSNDIARIYVSELLANPGLVELSQTGRKRGDAWKRWSEAVVESAARCQQPLFDVAEALFRCWQEMVERIGMSSISVHTKAVGQEITVPASELHKAVERVG